MKSGSAKAMAERPFHIPDSHVQHAFDVLNDKTKEHARARAAYEFSEKNLKTVLAHAAADSPASSLGGKEQDALRSDAYREALDAFQEVAKAYFIAKDRRDAAIAIIEAWRSIQANERHAGKIV